jgi:DNA-3-methyladenine glycosylase I
MGAPLYTDYHDREWGVPVHDDRLLFEFLILEGAQAGLSWATILRKREAYRKAFDNFDAEKIARYDEGKTAELMASATAGRSRRRSPTQGPFWRSAMSTAVSMAASGSSWGVSRSRTRGSGCPTSPPHPPNPTP